MIVTTVYLAASGGDGADPWRVLGNSGHVRLAVAALADLAVARALEVEPAADDESPAARRLAVVDPVPAHNLLRAAVGELSNVSRTLDIDRAVRALRNLSQAVEAELVAAGELVEQGQRGLLKKRSVLAARSEGVDAAQQRIRGADTRTAEARALVLIATAGLAGKRLQQMTGGATPAGLDPFDAFSPAAPAPDGAPIGPNGADLLTALITVLMATTDTTGRMDQ